ncbi:MAG TPA: ribosome recycling factor, partial [Lachnospiraceae bacterium]|nr:ribosome recycling factor [Lachnospiraceae bacterium]
MNEKLKEYEDRMKKTADHLASEFNTIRAGRANPHVLDNIKVDYYGTMTPVGQVGNISIPEARLLQIQPWDKT